MILQNTKRKKLHTLCKRHNGWDAFVHVNWRTAIAQSIFVKLEGSNWFVAYHQDLTINVVDQKEIEGFKNWTNKRGQIGVQHPIEYPNRTYTIKIYLDDTDQTNGALRVVPESHLNGVVRAEKRLKSSNEFAYKVKSR